jgi:hypothetical protein
MFQVIEPVQLYDSVVSPIMSLLSDLSQCVQTNSALSVFQGSVLSPLLNMNMDLDRIHQWSIENCLAINPKKSQALLVNPTILPSPIVSPLLLGSNHIAFVNKVKNLRIIFNQELTWHDQVVKLCRRMFFYTKAALDVFTFHTITL